MCLLRCMSLSKLARSAAASVAAQTVSSASTPALCSEPSLELQPVSAVPAKPEPIKVLPVKTESPMSPQTYEHASVAKIISNNNSAISISDVTARLLSPSDITGTQRRFEKNSSQ